ncbi:hypothetical protein M8C21_030319 [Ambrosia artemisiifolia]|uniref:Phloem protein 2-like protein n=1 Tax=Ambrosia artemisiifolia TaxID=4212 RepID=A0AAD5CNA9_AMBAR|nr:hypothetical protein M8C21_030319 [Ambrosia artemisiifolia]
MTKTAEPPLNYRSKGELRTLLSKGVLLNAGKTWFSLNKKGEHCEMISFAECLDSDPSQFQDYSWSSEYNSRFPTGTFLSWTGRFKTRVKSQLLSPQITYTVNLVFKFRLPNKAKKCHDIMSVSYKLQEETKFSISYLAAERGDEWYMVELYQFTSDQRIVNLEIQFRDPCVDIEIEGIEFRPLEKEDENVTLKVQPILDSDSNWEDKVPIDYEDIIKLSKNSMQWTTKKELYSIFRKGFLINDGQEWFSLDKTGKKCHMLSARMASTQQMQCLYYQPLPESRFGEVVELMDWEFKIITEINHQLVSSNTTYASYLVYKLPRQHPRYEAPVKVMDEELSSDHIWFIFFVSPQTPVIRPMIGQNTHNPLNRPKIKDLPQQRNDGWMEVKIWEFQTATTTKMIPMRLKFNSCGSEPPNWLLIQGVEFRPI